MTILFAGGEMGAFFPSDSAGYEHTDSLSGGASYDSAFARGYIQTSGSSSYNDSFEFTETADIWIHFEVDIRYPVQTSSLGTAVAFLNGSGLEKIQLLCNNPSGGTATWQLVYWNGTAFANLGSSFNTSSGRQTFDIHLVTNSASGTGTVYLSGTQRSSGTADLSGITGIAQIRGYGKTVAIAAPVALSQVIASTESTIGWRLKTIVPTGAGFSTAWTGGYTEVDELTYSDADFINTSSNDQDELFAHGTSIPSGYTVRGIAVTARAKKGSSGGPANIQLAVRSAGTTYYTSSQALDFGYGAHVGVWETDPATSADFTASAVTSLQFGVRSKA